jgi:hypothetical protein
MSLEQKIEELTEAIKTLSALMSKQSQPTKPIQTPEPKKVETHQIPVTTKHSVADLQSLCANKVRANPENKAKIKAILDAFGVKLIKDVPEGALGDLANHLEGL